MNHRRATEEEAGTGAALLVEWRILGEMKREEKKMVLLEALKSLDSDQIYFLKSPVL